MDDSVTSGLSVTIPASGAGETEVCPLSRNACVEIKNITPESLMARHNRYFRLGKAAVLLIFATEPTRLERDMASQDNPLNPLELRAAWLWRGSLGTEWWNEGRGDQTQG